MSTSETPETDREAHNVGNLAMLCRKLERERDEARREVVKLREILWDDPADYVLKEENT